MFWYVEYHDFDINKANVLYSLGRKIILFYLNHYNIIKYSYFNVLCVEYHDFDINKGNVLYSFGTKNSYLRRFSGRDIIVSSAR